jgi:hypothetical protein
LYKKNLRQKVIGDIATIDVVLKTVNISYVKGITIEGENLY